MWRGRRKKRRRRRRFLDLIYTVIFKNNISNQKKFRAKKNLMCIV